MKYYHTSQITTQKQKQPESQIVRCLPLERYLRKLGIEYHGNQGGKGRKTDPKRKPALEFIHSNASNSAKRNRLIDDGIKEFKCECCGLSEWMDRPIPLELHHIDFK